MSDEQALIIIYNLLVSGYISDIGKLKGTHPYFERFWGLWKSVKDEYPEIDNDSLHFVKIRQFVAFDRLKAESKQTKP